MRLGDPSTCGQCMAPSLLPRPGNVVCLEIGQPLLRCRLRLPDHWKGAGASSLRWIASGGSPLVFGLCTPGDCPDAFSAALEALESGLVLHAAHPNFGGTVTVGPYHLPGQPFAMLSHGCGCDLDQDFESAAAAARGFAFQVGRTAMLASAVAALEKAGI